MKASSYYKKSTRGMCFLYINTRALVGNAFHEGFYWPSAVVNAHEVVRTCSNYQKNAHYSKFPLDKVNLIPPVWPLARWGIDIFGPCPRLRGITSTQQ